MCVFGSCVIHFPSTLFLLSVYNSALKKAGEDNEEEAVKKTKKNGVTPVRAKWLCAIWDICAAHSKYTAWTCTGGSMQFGTQLLYFLKPLQEP